MTKTGESFAPKDDDAAKEGETYYRIGQMAKHFDISLRTLRFYEDKGLINPKRVGTTRLYSRSDKTRLKLVLLGRRIGFSLRDVKQLMDLYDREGSNVRQMKVTLEKSERQLNKLRKQRSAIDGAIGELTTTMEVIRRKLSTATSRAA
ncbi:MAG: MerR family DNA-binding transcriptional regulator [Rhizobiaceae bacterium]